MGIVRDTPDTTISKPSRPLTRAGEILLRQIGHEEENGKV